MSQNSRSSLASHFSFFLSGLASLGISLFIGSAFLKLAHSQTSTEEMPPLPEHAAPVTPPEEVLEQEIHQSDISAESGNASSEDIPLPTAEETTQTVPSTPSRGVLEGIIEDYNYQSAGRRDPFLPYTAPRPKTSDEDLEEILSPLQTFDLDQLSLAGIIWDVKKPKALFLDPQGKGYIVSKLDKVGRNRGYVAEIREGEVVIVERNVAEGKTNFQTRVIRLERQNE